MDYLRLSSPFNRESLCFVAGIRSWSWEWEVGLRQRGRVRLRSAFDEEVLSVWDIIDEY